MQRPDTHVCAIILAGGRSTRFGSDKASALLAGRPLLQWVIDAASEVSFEILVVAAQGQVLPEFTSPVAVRVVHDQHESLGPLAGIVTGFETATSTPTGQWSTQGAPLSRSGGSLVRGPGAGGESPPEGTLVLSCDVPLVAPQLLSVLLEALGPHAAAVPEVGGKLQPLVAAYRPSACLPHFRARLERGELGLTRALQDLDVLVVPESQVRQHDPDLRSFHNINTPQDLATAQFRHLTPNT